MSRTPAARQKLPLPPAMQFLHIGSIGMVLHEEVSFDKRGNPLAATYKDYHLPLISDVPTFEFLHANTPSTSLGGMRGVVEGGGVALDCSAVAGDPVGATDDFSFTTAAADGSGVAIGGGREQPCAGVPVG